MGTRGSPEETRLYYLQSRYYDPATGRFISPDSIEYLDPAVIHGLNLYVYCGNNPVMNVDPDGTWSWAKVFKTMAVVAICAVAVAAVALVTAATCGSATAVLVGAGIGAFSSIVSSAITQAATTGTVDIARLFVDGMVGAVTGAFGASPIGRWGLAVANGVTGFLGSVASDYVAGDEIDWASAATTGAYSAVMGFLSGGGAQHGKTTNVQKAKWRYKAKLAKGKKGPGARATYLGLRKILHRTVMKEVLNPVKNAVGGFIDFNASLIIGFLL